MTTYYDATDVFGDVVNPGLSTGTDTTNLVSKIDPIPQSIVSNLQVADLATSGTVSLNADLLTIAGKVGKSGDTMTGILDMGANKITTTATTFALNELVTKSDVNDGLTSLDNAKVDKAGDTMTGTLVMGANKITTTATTFALNELVTKSDVNDSLTSLDNAKVNKSGDTMTGTLVMGANKITTTATTFALDELVPKSDVNDGLTSLDNAKVNKAGDTMTGSLNMGANSVNSTFTPIANSDVVNKLYTDNQDDLRILKAGDTVTGAINLTSGATIQQDGVNAYLPLQKAGLIANVFCGGGGNSVVGASNSAYGYNALESVVDGQFNSAHGTFALRNLTSGDGNTAVGLFAGAALFGVDITTEDGNTMLGSNTKGGGFSNSIAIGTTAQTTASNQMMIGSVNSVVASTSADLGSTALPFKDLVLSGLVNGLGVVGNKFVQTVTRADYTTQTTFATVLSTGVGDLSSPANTFIAGTLLQFKVGGEFTCSNGNDVQFRIMGGAAGTTVLHTMSSFNCVGASTGGSWELEAEMTIRGTGAAAGFAVNANFNYYNNGGDLAGSGHDSTISSIDTTIVNLFDLQVSLIQSGVSINSSTFTLDRKR